MKANEVAKRLLADQNSCFKCSAFRDGKCRAKDDGSIPPEFICENFRKGLFVKWSKESELDLSTFRGVSAEEELTKMVSEAMSQEIDRMVQENLKNMTSYGPTDDSVGEIDLVIKDYKFDTRNK